MYRTLDPHWGVGIHAKELDVLVGQIGILLRYLLLRQPLLEALNHRQLGTRPFSLRQVGNDDEIAFLSSSSMSIIAMVALRLRAMLAPALVCARLH